MVNGYDVQRECFVLRTASGWITLVGARKGKFYVSLAVLCICLVFRCRGIGISRIVLGSTTKLWCSGLEYSKGKRI